MTNLISLWAPAAREIPEFKPEARYFAAMDCLVYLQEECSYRAVRLNALTTVLLHPYDDRPVGVKLKGMHYLHEKLKKILIGAGVPEAQLSGVKLISYWELALTSFGDQETQAAERERQRLLADRAKALVKDAGPVSEQEWLEAA